jgi:hypothetical protein
MAQRTQTGPKNASFRSFGPASPQIVAIAKKELKSSYRFYLYLQKRPNAIDRTGDLPLPVRITEYLVKGPVSALD